MWARGCVAVSMAGEGTIVGDEDLGEMMKEWVLKGEVKPRPWWLHCTDRRRLG